MIYKLIVGCNQRFYIERYLGNTKHTMAPFRNHSGQLPLPKRQSDRQDRILLFHMPCASYEDSFVSGEYTTISHDMQTGKQQIAIHEATSNNDKPSVCQDEAACNGCMQDFSLLQTCRQIYDEARSVLYQNNTFVFWGFDTFAAYFGFTETTDIYMPRSTEPKRLRAIQAMTRVELYGKVTPLFLSASRLIRAGLGCLTSLVSLELRLEFMVCFEIRAWEDPCMIDNSMFSKPSSLRKLIINVHNVDTRPNFKARLGFLAPGSNLATEKTRLVVAEALLRRLLKQGGFCDTTERFLKDDDIAACIVARGQI